MPAETASKCPNCMTKTPQTASCPHLLEGDECPDCSATLHKPPAGKVRCGACFHVVNGQYNDTELEDVGLPYRETRRFLRVFGYDHHGTPGTVSTKFLQLCRDLDVNWVELRKLFLDIRENGGDVDGS